MKIDLPYVHNYARRGKPYTYYRRHGRRQRIYGEPGSAQWLANYNRIHASFEGQPINDKRPPDALGRVIEAYLASPEFEQLAPKTRKDYRRYTDWLKANYGKARLHTLPTDFKVTLRDKFRETPAKANYMVRVMRLLCGFAEERPTRFKLPPSWRNPMTRPKMLKTGDGHRPWEDYEVDAFRRRWLIGSTQRMAFELLINTGQRGGDVIAMVRQQYRNGWISVTSQEKTGTRVDLPASEALRSVLDPWLANHPHIILLAGERGKKLGVDYFRHMMRDAYREASLPEDCTTHGLRYTAATILSELGIGWEEIATITGHETMAMVKKYTTRRRNAARAIALLDTSNRERGRDESG